MWKTEDLYYGLEPKEEKSIPEDDLYFECDVCEERICKDDEVIGFKLKNGEKVFIHADDKVSADELFDLLGFRYLKGEVQNVDMLLNTWDVKLCECA